MVTRLELLKEFASMVPDDAIVVSSIGNNSGFWVQLTGREANLLHITMGMCTPTALGLALGLPRRKVFALDADGNLLLNLGSLGTVAGKSPPNLTIIVSDNGNYLGSHRDEPGMPTATSAKLNLEGVARECGIASSHTVEDAKQFREKIEMALSRPGPHFIRARIQTLDDERPRKTRRVPDPRENKYQFAAYIEKTEGVQIIGSGLGSSG
jgi:thiamine pyrophosphate-dependent acetolactate synthase large subunit-like protein